MDQEEYAVLLGLIDKMIETSEPRRAEYFRGYRLGVQFRQLGTLEESIQEHFRMNESYAASGDHYVDSYAQGYRDGCRGRKLEVTA